MMSKIYSILTGFFLTANLIPLFSQADKGEVRLALTGDITANIYSNYNPGIQLNIRSTIRNPDNIMNRYDANPIYAPVLTPNPDIETFASNNIKNYLERIGFTVNTNTTSPVLNILIQQYEINYLSGNGWTGTVKMTFGLVGSGQYELYSYTSRGFYKMTGDPKTFSEAAEAINKAFFECLSKVDWNTVAGLSKQTESTTAANIVTATEENITKTNTRPVQEITINNPSDIDVDIPLTYQENRNTFAVIIGNEYYDNEIQVKYAINDAKTFYEYVIKTLGVPEGNVHYTENATFGKMLGEIDWINNVARVYEGEAKLIFYYAGHGMPDESSKSAYLLPVDGEASNTRTSIKVEELYAALSEYPVLQATVFLDACFSGGARDGMLASGRGVKIEPKISAPQGNLVVFSAASGDETAHPYEEKQHGMFSYYLMKKLQESKGDVTYEELSEYITTKVSQQSVVSGKEQNPTISVSSDVQATCGSWKLK
jgi:hypothetical protein